MSVDWSLKQVEHSRQDLQRFRISENFEPRELGQNGFVFVFVSVD